MMLKSSSQKQAFLYMRQQGASFTEIADLLLLSPNTVKSVCYRNGLQGTAQTMGTNSSICKNCGKTLAQLPGRKKKLFCSTQCRTEWWNKSRSRQPYRLTCCFCGKEFISFGNGAKKYCGRECYRLSRYGKGLP